MDKQKKQLHHVVGLDIGTYSLKLVESTVESNQLTINRILVIPIPEDIERTNPESFGKWLAAIWKRENLKTRTVRLTIPRYEVLTTELDLPSGTESETVKMLELQLERELPVPVDAVKSDYFVMLKNEMGNQKIMVISSRKELIEIYQNTIKQAGLKLDLIGLSSLSLNRTIQYGNPIRKSYIVLNIGYSTTELSIIENKRIVYSRSASFGIKPLFQSIHSVRNGTISNGVQSKTEPFNLESLQKIDFANLDNPEMSSWINQLIFELKRNLEAYTLEYGKPSPNQILFCGGGSYLTGLSQAIQTKLGIPVQSVEIGESFGKIMAPLSADGRDSEKILIAAAAIGLILPEEGTMQYCDLNEPRLFAEVGYQMPVQFRQVIWGLGTIAVLILILVGVLYQKKRYLVQLQSEYTAYRPLVMQSQQINVNMYAIRSWKQESISIIVLLGTISKLWADDAYLQVMTYDRTKDITLSGLASSTQAVAKLLKRLDESNQFAGIKLSYCRVSKRNPTYPIEFGLSMKYNQPFNSVQDKQSAIRNPQSAISSPVSTGGQ
jgi:type IV pilus assembly protein PilM